MKIYLLISAILILFSCNKVVDKPNEIEKKLTSTDSINIIIKEYINTNAHDPKTYEYIETKLLETVYYSDNLKNEIESQKMLMGLDSSDIKRFPDSKLIVKNAQEALREKNNKINICTQRLDSINKFKNLNKLAGYRYSHKCRMNNKMGGRTLYNYMIELNNKREIIYFGESIGSLHKIGIPYKFTLN